VIDQIEQRICELDQTTPPFSASVIPADPNAQSQVMLLS
jgi:hypothetical protein